MKLIYCTAVYGATDPLRDPLDVNPKVRYVAFTDTPQPQCKVWEVFVTRAWHHPRLQARLLKIKPHVFFPDADIYAWLDGSFEIVRDPTNSIVRHSQSHDILAFKHPHRTRAEAEAEAVSIHCGIPLELAQAQVAYYRKQGWVEQNAITSTGFFVRRNTKKVRAWQESWWEEVCLWTIRDQLSVDYTMHKHNITVEYFDGHYRKNRYLKFYKHQSTTPAPELHRKRGWKKGERGLK